MQVAALRVLCSILVFQFLKYGYRNITNCWYSIRTNFTDRSKLTIYRTRTIRPRSIYSIFHIFVCGLFEMAVYSRRRTYRARTVSNEHYDTRPGSLASQEGHKYQCCMSMNVVCTFQSFKCLITSSIFYASYLWILVYTTVYVHKGSWAP